MSAQPAPFNREIARRFIGAVRDLLSSEVRGKAIGLLVLLFLFAMSVNGLNVVNSYIGRDFMTAIAERDMPDFVRFSVVYIGVFAVTTVVSVLYRFTEERLGLLWRAWLTKRVTVRYLARRTYLRIKESAGVDNPDQRIAEDIRAFTISTLSFTLIFLNGILAAISFSGVLWMISPLLFGVAVGYAALGTIVTVLLGRRLIGLNYVQSGREADFRAALIHVRENADSVALLRREGRLRERLLTRIDAMVQNFRRITSVNRNLGFFTTGYNYLIQIIPALFIAPQFIRGEVEFGVITQSAIAFTQLLGAFSLIVNQFGSISSFGAVIARLGGFAETLDAIDVDRPSVETLEDQDRIAYDGLTLHALRDGAVLLNDLSVSIPSGMRVLVTGPNEAARVALFRATAGLWSSGEGRVVRPRLDSIFFVPQRPYLIPGSLRQMLIAARQEQQISDERILIAMRDAGLESLVNQHGGLDVEHDWATMLSLGEQQRLVIVRLVLARPSFAILDRVSTTLGPAQLDECLQRLTDNSITYINFDDAVQSLALYDAVLEIDSNGGWKWEEPRRADG